VGRINTAEFAGQFPGWHLIGVGTTNPVAVRDFSDRDGVVRTVGVNRHALVVFREPYSDAWDFYRSGSIYASENGGDLTALADLFAVEVCREIGAVVTWFGSTTGE